MAYILVLHDEDGNDYRGNKVYDTYEEAMDAMDEEMDSTMSYIDDQAIVGGSIEEE